LVVPSEQLERVALTAWAQRVGKVERIPNGIPAERFARTPAPGAIPGLQRRPDEVVIGTIAGLRPVKNLPRLVRAFAGMRNKAARLVIVGQGRRASGSWRSAPARGRRPRAAAGFSCRSGPIRPAVRHIRAFVEQRAIPDLAVEGMAAGLPVVATGVGDIPAIVSADNRPLIVAPDDERGFTAALDSLAERPDLRRAIGEANRRRVAAEYDERRMIEHYARLYGEAIRHPRAFMPADL
jgi:glycosyltransferase involved in cell wall biosynthesis